MAKFFGLLFSVALFLLIAAVTPSHCPAEPAASALSATQTAGSGSSSAEGLSPTADAAKAGGKHAPGAKGAKKGGGLSRTFDQNQPVSIQGHVVHFNQDNETLLAEGDVVLVSGDTEVHAERLWYDMKQGTLRAEGKVVVADASGNTLWAERLAMNQLSRTGEAQDILFAQTPWTAACGGADILPGDVVVLHGCECTSCRQESPMWRIWARQLRMKANDSLTAWGVWLYTGRVPVFYVPYFSHALKDPRPPVEIKPGYSSALGAYCSLGYNYYFGDDQFGTVRYDYMEKQGNGFGYGQQFKLLDGGGTVAGYYNADKYAPLTSWPNAFNPQYANYSFNFKDKQNLGSGLTLMSNVDFLSNPNFNEIFDMSQVDGYQQRSYVNLQSTQKTYSWSLQAGQTKVIESIPEPTPGPGGIATVVDVTQTVTSSEIFPSFSYTHVSEPLVKNSLLYWGLQASAQRIYETPQVLSDVAGTEVEVYDTADNYFLDGVTITPTLSDTIPIRHGLALTTVEGLNAGWLKAEGTYGDLNSGTPGPGSVLAGYQSSEDLQFRPRTGVTMDLDYAYQRQLAPSTGTLWSGEGENQASLKIQDQIRKDLSLLATETYDFLPYEVYYWDSERLSLVNLQSAWTPTTGQSANLSASYHVPTSQFKTVDASFNASDPKKLWQTNLSVDWVNNAITQVQPASDPTAPVELAYEDPRVTPDQLFTGIRNSLVLGPKWKISYYEQLDLVNRRINQQAYTVDRDFNCIDLQFYARQNLSVGWQYGFSISLSAAPGVKFDTNQLNADLFNPAQYGY